MHQDNIYLLSKPATCIAAWTAIDSADLDNGCLYVVPKSNRGDILCPEKGGETWLNYGDSHITKFPREQRPDCRARAARLDDVFWRQPDPRLRPEPDEGPLPPDVFGHYIDEASEQVARFYHPVLNMAGEVVSNITEPVGGGPCGDGFGGGEH